MAHAQLPVVDQQRRLTMRQDAWWVQPTVVAIVLASFIVYATWAAFQNAHYTFGPYLSPFIRRRSSAARRTRSSVRSLDGGRVGFRSRPHSSSCPFPDSSA